ncbi:MAG: hypothetical protein QM775_29230 [Pirellulales bacterium]
MTSQHAASMPFRRIISPVAAATAVTCGLLLGRPAPAENPAPQQTSAPLAPRQTIAAPQTTEAPQPLPVSTSTLGAKSAEEEWADFQQRRQNEARAKIPEWRKKYAYQSVAGRLTYEAPHRQGVAPPLSETSRKALAAEDDPQSDDSRFNQWANVYGATRSESLRLLHEEKVDQFVERHGFGISRMPRVGPESLESGGSESVAPESYPELSAVEGSVGPVALPVIQIPRREGVRGTMPGDDLRPEFRGAANPWLLPPRDQALGFHAMARLNFLSPARFGHVKNVDKVAGFEPHAFTHLPYGPTDLAQADKQQSRETMWKIGRLELVSLLKHETPRVYLSEHLPKMDELSSAKTRRAEHL